MEKQLEIPFGKEETGMPKHASHNQRAVWWFEQMRKAVNAAHDWDPPTPPPRQEALPGFIGKDWRN